MDILTLLPVEISEIILSYLSAPDLHTCFKVSKRWQNLVNNEFLWSNALPLAPNFPPALDYTDEDSEDMELCSTMKKYLVDRRSKTAWDDMKAETLMKLDTSQKWAGLPKEIGGAWIVGDRLIWVPSPVWSGGGSVVHLDVPVPPETYCEPSYLLGSPDSLLLAYSVANFIYLYSRPSITSTNFSLVELLACKLESFKYGLEDYDRLILTWTERSEITEREFLDLHLVTGCHVGCYVFSGFNPWPSSTEKKRILCVFDRHRMGLLIWDISSSSVTAYLEYKMPIYKVEPGWDSCGICVTLNAGPITCYDYKGEVLDSFELPSTYAIYDTALLTPASIVLAAVQIQRVEGENTFGVVEYRRPKAGEVSVGRIVAELEYCPLWAKFCVGPAYPVLVLLAFNTIILVVGASSTWTVFTLAEVNYLQFRCALHLVQFIDGSSYVLVGQRMFINCDIFEVELTEDSDHIVRIGRKRFIDIEKGSRIVWANTTGVAIRSFIGYFLVKRFFM